MGFDRIAVGILMVDVAFAAVVGCVSWLLLR